MWLDILFIGIFLGLEWLYYVKFRAFELDVLNQLLELNNRIEIVLERDEDRRSTYKMYN